MTNSKTEQGDWLGNRDDLVRRMAAEYGFTHEQAEAGIPDLLQLDSSLREPFMEWLRTKSLENAPEVCGYTIHTLLADHLAVRVPDAFLMLSDLIKDPEATLEHIEKSKYLQRNPIFISAKNARRQPSVIPQE